MGRFKLAMATADIGYYPFLEPRLTCDLLGRGAFHPKLINLIQNPKLSAQVSGVASAATTCMQLVAQTAETASQNRLGTKGAAGSHEDLGIFYLFKNQTEK